MAERVPGGEEALGGGQKVLGRGDVEPVIGTQSGLRESLSGAKPHRLGGGVGETSVAPVGEGLFEMIGDEFVKGETRSGLGIEPVRDPAMKL